VQALGALTVGVDLGIDFVGEGEVAVDFRVNLALLGKWRQSH
jgi:hypothetical protein